jgi:hypothetical protein
MSRWRGVVVLVFALALLSCGAVSAGGEDATEREDRSVDAWVLVLEPTEAYWNLEDGLWSMTDEVFWTAHAGEWYVLLIAVFDPVDGDRVLVFRDEDEDELPVWLLLDDRVEVFVEQDIPPLCGGAIIMERCVGTPLL